MPYYENQKNWTSNDFYCLHRYLHRMLFYYDKRIEEIKAIELEKLSIETKVIMYCIIKYYNLDFLFNLDNLKELKNCKPLNIPLILDEEIPVSTGNDIYKKMNIIY